MATLELTRRQTKRTAEFGRRLAVIAAGIVLTIGFYVLIGWQAIAWYVIVPEVDVPLLVGKSFPEAEEIARQTGIVLDPVDQVYDPHVAQGLVKTQDHVPHRRVKRGRHVGVMISLGPRMASVPDLASRTFAEATVALERIDLRTVVVKQEYAGAVAAGRIIRQEPPRGSVVSTNTPITLVVSTGPAIEMPQLVGAELDEAYRLLKTQGLAISYIQTRAVRATEPGRVLAQQPAAGTTLRRNRTSITLVISKPPMAGERRRPPRPSVDPPVPR